MTATRDLIAAALDAAELLEQIARFEDEKSAAENLREACASAMVEPDMAEVQRLLEAYDHEYASGGSVEDYDRARTALLDYVRGVMAERDGLMQTLRDEIDENLRLRELGGAKPDENITAMTERLIRERDLFRGVTKLGAGGWKLVQVTSQGVQFGNAWYSHESITGYDAQRLNSGACRMTARQYMQWVKCEGTAPQPVSACEKCHGAGWLRGYELDDADDATRDDTMTQYKCDACPHPVGDPCRVAQPAGWRCTRANGHEGPCAAVEDKT